MDGLMGNHIEYGNYKSQLMRSKLAPKENPQELVQVILRSARRRATAYQGPSDLHWKTRGRVQRLRYHAGQAERLQLGLRGRAEGAEQLSCVAKYTLY